MPKNNGNGRNSKLLDSARVAREWLERGIMPVPLKPGKKRPISKKGWNTLRVTEDTIDQFFNPGDNVGGLWGEPSGWIVDIDLDADEAADFALHYLPETFTYGRRSRPDTHYLYQVRGMTTIKRTIQGGEQKGESIVEVRSTGTQSVLPPSLHPDKERYEINNETVIKALSKGQIERYVNHVAAAALLLRNFPAKGSRHDFVHALTGALLWSGWDKEDARKFMRAIIEAIDDDDSRQRIRTVENTIDHFEQKDRISGWTTLQQWIEGFHIKPIREWLTPKGVRAAVTIRNGDEDTAEPSNVPRIPPFNASWLDVPGLVGEVAAWAGRRSYLQHPQFDLAVGLMCTALVSCNKYVVQGWTTPLQPYFMLLAPTAGGKGSAIDSVYDFAYHFQLHEGVFQGFQSYHAMLDKLSTPPGMACWLWDEAARRLKSTRNAGTFDYQVITWLLQMYGKSNTRMAGLPGRKNSIAALERPFLTIMATAQPAQMVESVTVSDLAMGLVNRFFLFDGGDGAADANLRREDIFPSKIDAKGKIMKRLEPKKIPIEIGYDNTHTYNTFREFDEEARKHAAQEGENEIWGRANQNALIAAGLVAAGVNPTRPLITPEIAAWAVELVRWSIDCWAARIDASASRSYRETHSKNVERYVRDAVKFVHRTADREEKKYLSQGKMPKRMLSRLCRHLTAKELGEIVEQLVESGLIGQAHIEDGPELYYGC